MGNTTSHFNKFCGWASDTAGQMDIEVNISQKYCCTTEENRVKGVKPISKEKELFQKHVSKFISNIRKEKLKKKKIKVVADIIDIIDMNCEQIGDFMKIQSMDTFILKIGLLI